MDGQGISENLPVSQLWTFGDGRTGHGDWLMAMIHHGLRHMPGGHSMSFVNATAVNGSIFSAIRIALAVK
jgi:hypothetical protein